MTEPSPRPPAGRPPRMRSEWITVLSAVIALAVGAAAAAWWLAPARRPGGHRPGRPVAPVAAAPVAAAPVAAAPAAAAPAPGPAAGGAAPAPAAAGTPRFDIVRIEPGGRAVIAGRAAPDAMVAVRADGHRLGRTRADGSGNWLLLPDRPLPPGPASLTLSATMPGGAVLAGRTPLHLTVPAAPQPAAAVPAAAARGGAAVAAASAAPVAPPARRALPAARAAAPPGAAAGRIARVSPPHAGGRPPHRPPYRPGQPAPRWHTAGARLAVRPGQSLWKIARQHYGKGEDYPTIYQANRTKIANPNLIFPGQTFALPAKPAPAAPAR